MRIARREIFGVVAAFAIFQANSSQAQHASDNPVASAEDAYGLTLGLESVGLYNPGLVRGFNPQAAGNIRIDGMYFDQQGSLSNRVIEGSTIRVGVSEIGYDFPAPTGIVDYDLRHPGDDTPSATIIANVGPYDAWGISIDGSVPLIGTKLVLPIGVGRQVSTAQPFGSYPGYTSSITSAGATPRWTPNNKISVRALIDWQDTRHAKAFPLFFTAGDFLPPPISRGYLGQKWAQGKNVTLNLGGILSAQLTDVWSLSAGLFRSTNDNPASFADLYTDIQPGGQSDHLVVGFPDQNTYSTSAEVRVTGTFTSDDWRHQVIFMAKGRQTTTLFGGADAVDLGPVDIDAIVQMQKPAFVFSARAVDHAELGSVGAAYHVEWRGHAELEMGIQKETYEESSVAPGAEKTGIAVQPVRGYANTAVALIPDFTFYTGYTQGLENSGVAPNSAQNSGTVLPASLTWQLDSGVRYAVTPKLKIIAGVFALDKPYFNLDANSIDRKLGVQEEKALELSIAGEPIKDLHINVGVLEGRVTISGPKLAAEGVGSVAVGQPHLTYVANIDYTLPWWPAASLDVSATHFGTAPESVDNGVYSPAATQVNIGGRYEFTALGETSTLRVQVQNVLDSTWWSDGFTPGFFQWPAPRTVFAYITTDLHG